MDPTGEDDAWAPDFDRQEIEEEARRQRLQEIMKEPVTTRSFLSAFPKLLGVAAVSLILAIVLLSRSGPVSKAGAAYFFLAFAFLVFVVIRGAVRTARTGSPQKKP